MIVVQVVRSKRSVKRVGVGRSWDVVQLGSVDELREFLADRGVDVSSLDWERLELAFDGDMGAVVVVRGESLGGSSAVREFEGVPAVVLEKGGERVVVFAKALLGDEVLDGLWEMAYYADEELAVLNAVHFLQVVSEFSGGEKFVLETAEEEFKGLERIALVFKLDWGL